MRFSMAYGQSQDEICGAQMYLPTSAAGTGRVGTLPTFTCVTFGPAKWKPGSFCSRPLSMGIPLPPCLATEGEALQSLNLCLPLSHVISPQCHEVRLTLLGRMNLKSRVAYSKKGCPKPSLTEHHCIHSQEGWGFQRP